MSSQSAHCHTSCPSFSALTHTHFLVTLTNWAVILHWHLLLLNLSTNLVLTQQTQHQHSISHTESQPLPTFLCKSNFCVNLKLNLFCNAMNAIKCISFFSISFQKLGNWYAWYNRAVLFGRMHRFNWITISSIVRQCAGLVDRQWLENRPQLALSLYHS